MAVSRKAHSPVALIALCVPGFLFAVGWFSLRHHPRFNWLLDLREYPWEFWLLGISGLVATCAGVADWRFHRSGQTAVGAREHRSEVLALAGGGGPLFILMALATLVSDPAFLLIPILVVVLFTAVLICYDEFVFHRVRCGRYETRLHRMLVFGNGIAWLAWMHWCFVRGGTHG